MWALSKDTSPTGSRSPAIQRGPPAIPVRSQSGTNHWQEAQIVLSKLNLRDFVP